MDENQALRDTIKSLRGQLEERDRVLKRVRVAYDSGNSRFIARVFDEVYDLASLEDGDYEQILKELEDEE